MIDVFISDVWFFGVYGEDCGWMSFDDLGGLESDIIFYDFVLIEVVIFFEGCL